VNQDQNPFGGGNARSLYVPMSDLEQEALTRLVESGDLYVLVLGWGVVHKPRIIYGDMRVSIQFRLGFDRPDVPIPVSGFDLELRTGTGLLLFKKWMKTEYDNKPIPCGAGIFYDVAWDIAIESMDPRLVKAIVPGAVGLTSRVFDKDTGDTTLTGNMQVSSTQRQMLAALRKGEAAVRADDAQQSKKIAKKTRK
jgi:hypothetical protein